MTNEINYSSCDEDIEYNLSSKYCTYCCNQNPDKICFNGQCIVYVKKGEYDASILKLASVPDVCENCYIKAMDTMQFVYQQKVL